ncbi:MAG: lysophospholipid acyltransferase family protein [Candidatus Cryosericum sp.]
MLYELVVPAGKLGFKVLFRLRVVGLENVPRHGPGLVCSNHCSYLDPMLAAVAVPRKLYSVSRKEMYEQRLLGPFIRRLGGVRIDREALADKGALQAMLAIMDHGDLCLIYPEGTRSADGKLQAPHNGAAFLAVKSGAPVLPMAVIGAYECWPRQRKFPRLGPITLRIGEPVIYQLPPERQSRKEDLSSISGDIMQRIAALLEEGQA